MELELLRNHQRRMSYSSMGSEDRANNGKINWMSDAGGICIPKLRVNWFNFLGIRKEHNMRLSGQIVD